MNEVSLTIDGKKIGAHEGKTILWVALENGIYIPNLCAIKEKAHPSASCRLCFVEVEGENEPVIACTQQVKEGVMVNTRGKNALRLARTSAELILASHPVSEAWPPRACPMLPTIRSIRRWPWSPAKWNKASRSTPPLI